MGVQKTIQSDAPQEYHEHEKLKMLLTITRNISIELDLNKLLMIIMDKVKDALQCDRCTVFILDTDKKELWSRVAHGEKEIRFPAHKGIAGFVASTGQVVNIPDAYDDTRFNPDIDKKTGYHTRTVLAAPMRNRLGEIIGVFQALNKLGSAFSRDDEEILDIIATISASQIENAQLYAEQKKTFDSFIETLASTIDARDPMTAGHSQRIALYADQIAQVVNLPDQDRAVLRTAALLHDYGKIAVREAVLTKEGSLNKTEFKHIQNHPLFTNSILEKINFSRALKDVPLIAGAHHERLDGSGYPQGLKGNEIPKLSRILAIVDVFDALTSKRHYRDRMNFLNVVQLLSEGTGTQFDEFYLAALKKIPVSKLVEILENDNKEELEPKDLKFLSDFTTSDLIRSLQAASTEKVQKRLAKTFQKYYLRKFIKKSKKKKTK